MSLTTKIIAKAESFDGICAGMVPLENVLKGPSYRAVPDAAESMLRADDGQTIAGNHQFGSVLVLGLMHPASDPRLDWWERGDSWGNRHLRKISENLKQWLRDELGLKAQPLPYHLEKGGLFLKDAAVLSGLGIIGRNNLLLHPEWGPRIRLRSILIAADLPPTPALEEVSPCEACERFCQKACPVEAFPQGKFSRALCIRQMNADEAHKVAEGEIDENGKSAWVVKNCRACELICPVGG